MDLTVVNIKLLSLGMIISIVSYLSIYFTVNTMRNLLDRL